MNLFVPSTELIAKLRVGSKIIKKYDPPKTPFHRILESPFIPQSTKE
jgi:hypothetical protein